jgi:hypothetical protein
LHDYNNVQRPTPNVQRRMQKSEFSIERWALSVRRLLLIFQQPFS